MIKMMNILALTQYRSIVTAAIILAALLLANTTYAAGELTAKVDRTQIGPEETLKLNIRYNEQVMFGEPDFSALKQNFDILGNHRSNQYRSVNGKAESWTQWSITLAPKKEGKLLIPSFKYEGSFSEAIEVNVKARAAIDNKSSDQPLFMEAVINQKKAFVQEQVLLTLRLYTTMDLSGLNRDDFRIDNALVKQVAENQFQRTMNGKAYGVVEMTYAIFPQQSGTLTVPAVTWDVTTQNRQTSRYDPFLNRSGQRFRLKSKSLNIDILPKPSNYNGDHWLPAQELELRQSWSAEPSSFKVGEPITRTISIHAKGLMASQLPPIEIQQSNAVKYYPDQPQSDESLSSSGITTVKTESYAIVPNRSGRFTLPAVTLTWWDTSAGRMREASLPEQAISVAASANTTAPPIMPTTPALTAEPASPLQVQNTQSQASHSLWVYSTCFFALTSFAFAALWLTGKATPRPTPRPRYGDTPHSKSEKQAYKDLQKALLGTNLQNIRATLLAWAQVRYDKSAPSSLGQLAALAPEFATSISQLEKCLFGQEDNEFNADQLSAALKRARSLQSTQSTNHDRTLPALYS